MSLRTPIPAYVPKARAVGNWLPLVLPAALTVFYFPVLTGSRFFWEDAAEAYPGFSYLASSLRHLKLPYWSPYTSGGSPMIADLHGVFYPPNWLLSLFVGSDGRIGFWVVEMEVILHLLLAGWFMYLLARDWRLSEQASAYAGLTFILSGFMTVHTIHSGIIVALAWFPLALFFVNRALVRHRFGPALAAGLVMGLATLGGHPQMIMHMAYALGFYVLAYVVRNWKAEGPMVLPRGAAALGLVGLVGIGIASAQYLPTLELLRNSDRASSGYQFITHFSLAPARLLTLLVPKAFGSVSGPSAQSTSVLSLVRGSQFLYWETVIYLGILPLLLAGFALADRKQHLRWFFIAMAAVTLTLVLGKYTPLYRIIMAVLPGFGMFRAPGRLSDLFTFAMAIMSGFGMELFLRDGTERLARNLLKVIAACAGWAVLVWIMLSSGQLRTPDPQVNTNLVRQWSLFTALAISAVAVVYWRTRKNWAPAVGYWLIVGITFLDLFAFGHDFNASRNRPTQFPFARSDAVTRIQQESKLEAFRASMSDSGSSLGRNRGIWDHVEMLEGYNGWQIARSAQVGRSQHVLNLLNVKYEIDTTGRHLIPNPGYLPRARMVYQYHVAASDSAALKTVREGEFDYRNSAVLEHDPGFRSRPGDSIRNEVVITRRESDRMELRVQTDGPGILVLSEVYYPAWKALVDGRPAEIYPVDYVLRGITLTGGSHRVEMYFDRSLVRLGVLISLLTLIITVGLVLLLRRRVPAPTPSGPECNAVQGQR